MGEDFHFGFTVATCGYFMVRNDGNIGRTTLHGHGMHIALNNCIQMTPQIKNEIAYKIVVACSCHMVGVALHYLQ